MDNDETFDEMSDEVVEAQEPDPTDLVKQVEFYKKRAERAEKQAVERKVLLGRFETASKHGISAESIPDWVPLDKMDEFAERFAVPASSPAPVPTEQEAPAAERVVSDQEQNLAAVAKGPASSGTPTAMSSEDAMQLAMTDPARYAQLRDAGVISLPKLPGADIGR